MKPALLALLAALLPEAVAPTAAPAAIMSAAAIWCILVEPAPLLAPLAALLCRAAAMWCILVEPEPLLLALLPALLAEPAALLPAVAPTAVTFTDPTSTCFRWSERTCPSSARRRV